MAISMSQIDYIDQIDEIARIDLIDGRHRLIELGGARHNEKFGARCEDGVRIGKRPRTHAGRPSALAAPEPYSPRTSRISSCSTTRTKSKRSPSKS